MKARAFAFILGAVFAMRGAAQTQPTQRAGFPLTIPGTGLVYCHPAVGDMKWTGAAAAYKSIAFTSWSDSQAKAFLHLVRYNGTTWAEAPNFPIAYSTAESTGSPAIADLDGDGIPEIVAPYGSSLRFGLGLDYHVGGVKAYKRDGTLLWDRSGSNGQPTDGADWPFAVVGAPAVADVDGDGKVEVAWGSYDGKVYLVDGPTGVNKPGWPIFVAETIWSSPVLFDFDGDGKMEIIIGVDSTVPAGGILHVFKFTGSGTGTYGFAYPHVPAAPELPGFPKVYDQVLYSAPAVGDIDGDGKPEIVFGTGTYWGNPAPCGGGGAPRLRRVYAVKCDGSSPTGWPVTVVGEVKTSPALADLDGDGKLDVVVTDFNCVGGNPTDFSVYGFKGTTGGQLFRTKVMNSAGGNYQALDPVVADIVGDANVEILVPTGYEIAVFTKTGVQLTPTGPATGTWVFQVNGSLFGAVAVSLKVAPVASDPVDVIAISSYPYPQNTDSQISVWNPKSNPLPAPPWGMFRQNVARLAVAPGTAACTSPPPPPPVVPLNFTPLTPCRVFDMRQPADAPSLGPGASRTFDLAGKCGIPVGALAISANVTVTNATAFGSLTLFQGGGSTPLATMASFGPGQTRANAAVLPLSNDAFARIVVASNSSGTVDVIFDVNGYFK